MPKKLIELQEHLAQRQSCGLRLTGLNWYSGFGDGPKQEPLGLLNGRFVMDLPPSTPSLDLSGLTLLPGLCDAHLHLFGEAQRRARVDLAGIRHRQELWQRLEAGPAEGPLVAMAWDESEWDDPRFPQRDELDQRFPGREVMLVRVCGHVVVASSAALTHLDEAPDLGSLEQGLLLEGEAIAIRRRFTLSPEELLREAKIVASELAAEGITSVTEMGANQLLEVVALLDHDFPLRVEFYHHETAWKSLELPKQDLGLHHALGRKFFLDGSIGGRSAALEVEYLDGAKGELLWADEYLDIALADLLAQGYQAALHAIGTRAVDQALQALERAQAPAGAARIEHLETANPHQLEAMASRGVGAGFQPNFFDRWGRPGGLYQQRLGDGYRELFPGPADLRSAGLSPAYGTDGMPRDLWGAMRAAADDSAFGPSVDSPEDILSAVTHDAARLARREKVRGSVSHGLSADFAIYDTDPVAMAFGRKCRPLLSVLAGRVTAFRKDDS